ncbi:MAG: thioredoxin [Alphaproteobacteria bacterium]|jgi:thioredoxin 1|nr:thioredoxin [Alphaproteobacteria bacterium]
MALEHANDTTFDAMIGNGITLVDFWASWCGPCRMFGPIFEETSEKVSDVKFIKFEIDETNRRTAAKYGIRSIPAVLAFKNGELVEARTGLMDQDTLLMWIQELKGTN